MHYVDAALSLLEASLSISSSSTFNVALLHASLFPLCAMLKSTGHPRSPPTTPHPSSLSLLHTLSSPSSSSEAVTLCVIALSLHHSSGGGTARTVVEALLPSSHDTGSFTGDVAQQPGDSSDSSGTTTTNLSAAISSGFLGLLNALSTCSDSGGGMCFLDGALSDEVALLPLAPTHLTRVVVDFLVACLEECERVKQCEGESGSGGGGGGGGSDEGRSAVANNAASLLPSPLRARVADGAKVLYASDARVALEIALRAAGDLPPTAAEPWVTLLVGLQRFCCKGYKQAEIEALLLEAL